MSRCRHPSRHRRPPQRTWPQVPRLPYTAQSRYRSTTFLRSLKRSLKKIGIVEEYSCLYLIVLSKYAVAGLPRGAQWRIRRLLRRKGRKNNGGSAATAAPQGHTILDAVQISAPLGLRHSRVRECRCNRPTRLRHLYTPLPLLEQLPARAGGGAMESWRWLRNVCLSMPRTQKKPGWWWSMEAGWRTSMSKSLRAGN